MAASFFFYDLETSGFSPREARIMQFAGQRTDMDLQPIGEPVNYLLKLTPDVLPDPDAILITGITPQATLQDGLTEAEFLKIFYEEVFVAGTIFLGFNSVRFDDEFMRFLLWRNFYDAYEWHWRDSCSRWDLLDVVRMTRALRPEGIEWPFAPDGKPSNRLEYLTKLNKLDHLHAHDALSDVKATIAVAKLIHDKQPKLFEFLLGMRDKKKVEKLALAGQPFVYTSGKYPSEFEKTTVVTTLAKHPKKQAALVFDLRHDPTPFLAMTAEQLAERWQWTRDEAAPPRLPVKTLQYNRCPAVAPLGVLKEADTMQRLQLDLAQIEVNRQKLSGATTFKTNLLKAVELLDKQQQTSFLADEQTVDNALYEDFITDADKRVEQVIRSAPPTDLPAAGAKLKDERLKQLLPLYKARNFPSALTSEERQAWDKFCFQRLQDNGATSRLGKFGGRLQALAADKKLTQNQRFLLEELQLYAESIVQFDPSESS
jgi:exodeoxyribonuclease-1